MTNSEIQRKLFWDAFYDVYMENGGDSLFTYAQKDSWAVLNKPNAICLSPHMSIDFSTQKGLMRLNVHCYKEKLLWTSLKAQKEELENTLGFSIVFSISNNGNYNIEKSWYFNWMEDADEYRRVIESALPAIVQWIRVFKPYAV